MMPRTRAVNLRNLPTLDQLFRGRFVVRLKILVWSEIFEVSLKSPIPLKSIDQSSLSIIFSDLQIVIPVSKIIKLDFMSFLFFSLSKVLKNYYAHFE